MLEISFYNELKSKLNEVVNAGTHLRFEKMFAVSNNTNENEIKFLTGLTREEKDEIDKRKRIE
jgi:hypothetical protein